MSEKAEVDVSAEVDDAAGVASEEEEAGVEESIDTVMASLSETIEEDKAG
jgi:hypothetical protein